MGLSDPWGYSYLNGCKVTPNFDHQTLPNKHLFCLGLTPVSDEQTLIKYASKQNPDDDDDDKPMDA